MWETKPAMNEVECYIQGVKTYDYMQTSLSSLY